MSANQSGLAAWKGGALSGAGQRLHAGGLPDIGFVLGVASMPFQSTEIGPLQPPHIWLAVVLPCLLGAAGAPKAYNTERVVFLLFITYAAAITLLGGVDHVKAYSQILKFAIVYPGFYLAGRYYGARYADGSIPLGYGFLFLLLAFEIIVERLAPPMLYNQLDFAEGALHGTFKERNWFADFFFAYSYLLFLTSRSSSRWKLFAFFLLNLAVMILSGSKTAMIACVFVIAFKSNGLRGTQVLAIALGLACYAWIFASDFSEEQVGVRLEQERGLAFTEAMDLISARPFGYGFGFVESYFQNLTLEVRGLGAGTNALFSAPLDLMVIAGPLGLVVWLVFFAGIGIEGFPVLFPIAALSLLNPLHQSEFIYFFVGMLLSIHAERARNPARL